MADITINDRAYCKVILHAFKYPHRALNGLLLARKPKSKDEKSVQVIDAIPLFHITLGLTPMIEVALLQIDQYCKSQDLVVVGYYQANENYRNNSPDNIAVKISDKLLENFGSACLMMIDNEKLSVDSDKVPLIMYTNNDGKWVQKDKSGNLVNSESNTLDSACALLHSKAYRELMDFDNHLDDVSCDWLNLELNSEIANIS